MQHPTVRFRLQQGVDSASSSLSINVDAVEFPETPPDRPYRLFCAIAFLNKSNVRHKEDQDSLVNPALADRHNDIMTAPPLLIAAPTTEWDGASEFAEYATDSASTAGISRIDDLEDIVTQHLIWVARRAFPLLPTVSTIQNASMDELGKGIPGPDITREYYLPGA